MTFCSIARLFAFVIAAAIVGDHYCVADKYCCVPQQFVSTAGQFNGLVLSSGQGIAQLNSVDIAFDYTNDRLGEEISSFSLGRLTKIKVIIDYKKNVMYTILGQRCTKTEARGNFEQCIPKTFHFDGSSYFGDNELTFDSYSSYVDVPKVSRGNITYSVTHKTCIPAGSTLVGEATATDPPIPLISTTGFANFTRGIRDPGEWFTVPSICQKSGRFVRSVRSIFDDHKEVMQLVSIFNTMVLPGL